MRLPQQDFISRQHMETSDFEFFYFHDNNPVEVDFHNHDFYEIYLFLSGDVVYIIEGKSYKLKPMDLLIINNKELHKAFINTNTPYERIVIWINPDYIKSLSTDKTDLHKIFDSLSNDRCNLLRLRPDFIEYIYETAQKLCTACKSTLMGSDVLRRAYILEFLTFLNRAYEIFNGKDIELDVTYNDKITKAIRYINENLDGDISLEVLSSKFYMSKYHLLREFKKNTGYTIHRYILQKRLIMAKELLKECRHVTEVCNRCGFGDYSNFIRAFKKEFGTSPKKFCKKYTGG